jgi:hypothetical protein
MGETTLSRLCCKRSFPMKRFLVVALVSVLSVAGGAGLAFGSAANPKTPTKPQAMKPIPPEPPQKQPPSKPPTPASKPPDHRKVIVDVPKAGPKSQAKKDSTKPGQAKPGNGSKSGKDSYSWDDYKRDLDKDVKGFEEGVTDEAKSVWDGLSKTGQLIGSWLNDKPKSNPTPGNPRFTGK